MATDTVAERALVAGRTKVFFPGWRATAKVAATSRKSPAYRFVRVGFGCQTPLRPSLRTEFFNADACLTAGPLSAPIAKAYVAGDFDVLEYLLLISLFAQGPAFWQSGSLRPTPAKHPLTAAPLVYDTPEAVLYWSGTDTAPWQSAAEAVLAAEGLAPDTLKQLVAGDRDALQC